MFTQPRLDTMTPPKEHLHPTSSVPEKMRCDTSVRTEGSPFRVIAAAAWSRDIRSQRSLQAFDWYWPEFTPVPENIIPLVVIKQMFTLKDKKIFPMRCVNLISAVHMMCKKSIVRISIKPAFLTDQIFFSKQQQRHRLDCLNLQKTTEKNSKKCKWKNMQALKKALKKDDNKIMTQYTLLQTQLCKSNTNRASGRKNCFSIWHIKCKHCPKWKTPLR